MRWNITTELDSVCWFLTIEGKVVYCSFFSLIPPPSIIRFFSYARIMLLLTVPLLSCVWLFWDPTDCSPLGTSVHGISQARILEWVVISFSRGSSQPRDRIHVSCLAVGFFTTELPGNSYGRTIETILSLKKVTDFFQYFLTVWKTLVPLSEFSRAKYKPNKVLCCLQDFLQ